MKGNNGPELRRGNGDSAVSPVIAVILMVAITVVLAATVYVWVSGFTDTGNQAPSANFRFVSCDDTIDTANQNNNVTVRLTSGGPLQMDDSKAILFNRSDDSQEGQADPLASSGQWSTGSQKVFGHESAQDIQWDSNLTDDLTAGNEYRLDFIHKPTESSYATLPFTC